MNNILQEPVLLPNSNIIVDKSTIIKHLERDPTDPFTRSQLTIDMVIPQENLKNRIQTFFAEKRKEGK